MLKFQFVPAFAFLMVFGFLVGRMQAQRSRKDAEKLCAISHYTVTRYPEVDFIMTHAKNKPTATRTGALTMKLARTTI